MEKLNVAGAYAKFDEKVAAAVSNHIKQLLETKHLYQSVVVSAEEIAKGLLIPEGHVKDKVAVRAALAKGWTWHTDHFALSGRTLPAMAFADRQPPHWTVPDLTLYCTHCGKPQPFNPLDSTLLLRSEHEWGINERGAQHQVYSLTYLCQGCKRIPEVFLVTRKGLKFTLTGRSVLEHVHVASEIPKRIEEWYSGAVVARQSGQVLAGLFMLRVCCEQWARAYATPGEKTDVAIEKYMQLLPKDFKARFPSLKEMYEKLSAAIHAAKADEELFASTLAGLSKHFLARKLFDLPDAEPAPSATKTRTKI